MAESSRTGAYETTFRCTWASFSDSTMRRGFAAFPFCVPFCLAVAGMVVSSWVVVGLRGGARWCAVLTQKGRRARRAARARRGAAHCGGRSSAGGLVVDQPDVHRLLERGRRVEHGVAAGDAP